MKILLSIVIPVFNESKIIEKNIIEVAKWIKDHKKLTFEIIVVDDGSTDNTRQVLNKAKSKMKYLKVLFHLRALKRSKKALFY